VILHNGVDAKFSENNQTTLNRLELRNKRNIKPGQHLIKIGNCASSKLYIPPSLLFSSSFSIRKYLIIECESHSAQYDLNSGISG
jgi:hypothetical protein